MTSWNGFEMRGTAEYDRDKVAALLTEIGTERDRQVERGATPENDEEYRLGRLSLMAASFAEYAGRNAGTYEKLREQVLRGDKTRLFVHRNWGPINWPSRDADSWKLFHGNTDRENLVRAAALIVAELELYDRRFPNGPDLPEYVYLRCLCPKCNTVDVQEPEGDPEELHGCRMCGHKLTNQEWLEYAMDGDE